MGGNNQSQIDDLREEARNQEEAFEQWSREQRQARAAEEQARENRARETRQREDRAREKKEIEDRAREDRQREDRVREERQREARHKRELEELAIQMKQMEIDRKNKEDEEARAREERKKKEKEEEKRIREEKIRKEKEKEVRNREERERQAQLRAQEVEKKRMQNIANLRAEIKEMKPGESLEFPEEGIHFPKRLNIGLYGATGIGKTSLMNSLKFAVNGELKGKHREQAAPAAFQGGHTTRRMAVRVTKYLTFVDNRGVGAEDLVKDGAAEELIIQLEGKRSFATEVDWGKSSRPDDMDADETKKIYCTVLVFNARNVEAIKTIIGKFVERLLKWQGRFPLAVITHVDEASQAELDNMHLVLKMAGMVDVYEVANITDTKENLESVYQENLLKLLHKCVKDGDRIFELRHEIELEEKKKEKRKNKLAN